MSVGHLYHYVENKEALIEAVIRRELDRQMARLIELETATPGELADALLQKVSSTSCMRPRYSGRFSALKPSQRRSAIQRSRRFYMNMISTCGCDFAPC